MDSLIHSQRFNSWAWVMAAYAKFKALQGQSSKKSALNIVWGC